MCFPNKDANSHYFYSSIGPQATALLSSVTLDTSLAAIATPDGNRRVFFQDGRNHVRQALFQNSTGAWSSDPTFIIATNARNHTPIAVYMDETEDVCVADIFVILTNILSSISFILQPTTLLARHLTDMD